MIIRPADTGEDARGRGRPEPVRDEGEGQMRQDGEPDAAQIDSLRVDPVGERDEEGNRDGIGGIEQTGDPAGFAVGQGPAFDHARQKRGPDIGANLDADLCGTDDKNELHRRKARSERREHGWCAALGFRAAPPTWQHDAGAPF